MLIKVFLTKGALMGTETAPKTDERGLRILPGNRLQWTKETRYSFLHASCAPTLLCNFRFAGNLSDMKAQSKIGKGFLPSIKLQLSLVLQLFYATVASGQACDAAANAAILLATPLSPLGSAPHSYTWVAALGWNDSTDLADWPGVTCNSSGLFM